jgi:hypothetical protein
MTPLRPCAAVPCSKSTISPSNLASRATLRAPNLTYCDSRSTYLGQNHVENSNTANRNRNKTANSSPVETTSVLSQPNMCVGQTPNMQCCDVWTPHCGRTQPSRAPVAASTPPTAALDGTMLRAEAANASAIQPPTAPAGALSATCSQAFAPAGSGSSLGPVLAFRPSMPPVHGLAGGALLLALRE